MCHMKNKCSVMIFTQGINVPSTRFRVGYLKKALSQKCMSVSVADAYKSSYPPLSIKQRFGWLVTELYVRLIQVLKSQKHDAVILQREFLSTLPTLEFLTKRPRILDVDDAIWMHRKGWAANTIARHADHIVCGNKFLAEYFEKFGKPVTIIPTPVDTRRFISETKVEPLRIIGWSGTSGGFRFLYSIQKALAAVLRDNQGWKLRIVSDAPPIFTDIPEENIEFIKWSVEDEVSTIASMDIGIMPLDDNEWSRGKCSYKMLLYMACEVPVVVSDCGMNSEVLAHGPVGYGAVTESDWYDYLTVLINDPVKRETAGKMGRKVVLDHYSVDQAIEKWEQVIKSVLPHKAYNID